MSPPLLQVRNLTTRFNSERGRLTAVDQVSFDVGAGETVAIVGEFGIGQECHGLVDHAADPIAAGPDRGRRSAV